MSCILIQAFLPTNVRGEERVRSLRTSAWEASTYPAYCSTKRLGVFLNPHPFLDGMLVHHRVTLTINFAATHLYTWVEIVTVREKYLAQVHNTMSTARARTRTARSKSSALIMRPPRLPSSRQLYTPLIVFLRKLTIQLCQLIYMSSRKRKNDDCVANLIHLR